MIVFGMLDALPPFPNAFVHWALELVEWAVEQYNEQVWCLGKK